MEDMEEKEVDIWGWAETNVNWIPNLTARAKYYGNKIFKFFTLNGTDSKGLGRWSYVQIAGRNQRKITIATAYRPCKQSKPGNSIVTVQQKRLLCQKGVNNPQPCTAWTKDLCKITHQWTQEGEVILIVDAKSILEDRGFALFIAEAGLCNVLGCMHEIDSPNTQANGSKAIDFIVCTQEVMTTVQHSGMLRFYDEIHSDHRGLYCNINILHILHREVHHIAPKTTRRYHTHFKKRGCKYRAA
eukprot:8044491-Ditylum_brightwellii.AAC.1